MPLRYRYRLIALMGFAATVGTVSGQTATKTGSVSTAWDRPTELAVSKQFGRQIADAAGEPKRDVGKSHRLSTNHNSLNLRLTAAVAGLG
jgi:hypothetical protein